MDINLRRSFHRFVSAVVHLLLVLLLVEMLFIHSGNCRERDKVKYNDNAANNPATTADPSYTLKMVHDDNSAETVPTNNSRIARLTSVPSQDLTSTYDGDRVLASVSGYSFKGRFGRSIETRHKAKEFAVPGQMEEKQEKQLEVDGGSGKVATASGTVSSIPNANTNSNGVVKHQHSHRQQQQQGSNGGSNVFATENSTIVMAQIGGTATLPCVVRKFNTGVVSWIRKVDYHLLTVGLTTYNADDRFLVEHIRHLQNWGLLIKHVQPSDEGLYECQVSTHPPTSIFVELKVTEASAEITGAPDLHLRAGSTLRLLCTLRQSTEPPAYVFWYHEHRMINYDAGVNVSRTRGGGGSVLVLAEADKTHNGNYTCSPSNAIPASINVHVLNATAEEQPAAMQHANTSTSSSSNILHRLQSVSILKDVAFLLSIILLPGILTKWLTIDCTADNTQYIANDDETFQASKQVQECTTTENSVSISEDVVLNRSRTYS